jgi:CheY-like chemotaxis protein/transcriptional regulator with XRE-family HTH domain
LPLILIIDDDVALLSGVGAQLAEAGYSVATSSDLVHAEQLYIEERPDLVLLDVRSGRDKGWELLGRLAAATPVVVLSAASREEDVVRGFAAGAVDYIAKPYRSAELLARLRVRLAFAAPILAAPPATAPADEALAPRVGTTERLADSPPPRRSPSRREEEESVFMSEAEEMALLRMPDARSAAGAADTPAPSESLSLGGRLRAERQRRHLTLVQVENELKIRMSYLQALEDEKFTLIPRGPVALQMVRSYVTFLGIEPEAVVDEFRANHYVEQNEPLPALGGSRLPRSVPRWLILLVAALLALAVAVGAISYFDPVFFQNLWGQIMGLIPRTP